MLQKTIDKKKIALLIGLVIVSFIVIVGFAFPVDYDNLSGTHTWLSGSTIKFVNMWLQEGAGKLHFTCYEYFNSIEHSTVDLRSPYISYPTGTVTLVYLAAKVLGRTQIDISFLKHYEVVCFCLAAVFLAVFLYVLLSDLFEKLNDGFKIAAAGLLTVFWILLPNNIYYLCNIYFADQCVILWVMLFLLLEYLSIRKNSAQTKEQKTALNILKAVVTFIGMMIDYYFWILVFIAFLFRMIGLIIKKNTMICAVKKALWYVIPVVMALVCFLIQLSYTENWLQVLLQKAAQRTGDLNGVDGINSRDAVIRILGYIYNTFMDIDKIRAFVCLVLVLGLVIVAILYLTKKKNLKMILCDGRVTILLIGLIAPLLQITVLREHSAVHEFSLLKLGWCMVALVILTPVLLSKLYDTFASSYKVFKLSVVISFVLVVWIVGMPFSTKQYTQFRYWQTDYSIEEAVREYNDYENVFFSFTYSVPGNPPQQLAITEKSVYQIDSLAEIEERFPNLDESAVKILLIDKTNQEKTETVIQEEQTQAEQGTILYDDDNVTFVKLAF